MTVRALGLFTALAASAIVSPVAAQGVLADAEEAYLEVDFERTLSAAQSAEAETPRSS